MQKWKNWFAPALCIHRMHVYVMIIIFFMYALAMLLYALDCIKNVLSLFLFRASTLAPAQLFALTHTTHINRLSVPLFPCMYSIQQFPKKANNK